MGVEKLSRQIPTRSASEDMRLGEYLAACSPSLGRFGFVISGGVREHEQGIKVHGT
jgi:hypothetical protein